MAISRTSLALAAAAAALAAAAVAQQQPAPDVPESLLPPGFGETAPPPPPADGNVFEPPAPTDTPSPTPTPTPDAGTLAAYELPPSARRSLATVGVAGPADGGVAPDGFGDADGRYVETLMRRLSAPLPSRWLSIALRRALVSRLDTPAGLDGADFAAERAWLLLRMGEANEARRVVQDVDNANYTLKLAQVALQVALATGDPAAVCGIAGRARAVSAEGGWRLAQTMCAALSGDTATARAGLAQARRWRWIDPIDLKLAQKVVAAGSGGRAVTIEWDAVGQLTAWRFGLATATAVAVPEQLYATVGPQLDGWRVLAPAIPLADRAVPADRAAALGILSSAAYVDLLGAIADEEDAPPALSAVATDLGVAYAGADAAARLQALRDLWNGAAGPRARYGRLVLTARAATRVAPGSAAADADHVIAAMLSAGLDRTAQRWAGSVPGGGDAWAMLTLADPDARGPIGYRALAGYTGGGDAALKQRLLFAGLAGLGRLSDADVERAAQALTVPIGRQDSWTRALDRAVRARQPATVLLLVATGMQTGAWNGVPPAALYRAVAALRAVGLDGYARMIAAEAIARA